MGRFELNEDFWSPIIAADGITHGERAWEFLGASGSRAVQTSESGAPGILRLNTGATNGNSALIFLGSVASGDTLLENVSYFSVRLRPSSSTSTLLRFGFGDDLTDGNFGSNGLYFEQSTAAGGLIHTVARNATLEDDDATVGEAINTGFRTFEFIRSEATIWHAYQITAAGVRTFLNFSHTRIPTAAVSFGVRIETLTNAVRSLDIDRICIRSTPLARR